MPLVFPCLLILAAEDLTFVGGRVTQTSSESTAQAHVKAEGRRLDRLWLSFAGQTPGS